MFIVNNSDNWTIRNSAFIFFLFTIYREETICNFFLWTIFIIICRINIVDQNVCDKYLSHTKEYIFGIFIDIKLQSLKR